LLSINNSGVASSPITAATREWIGFILATTNGGEFFSPLSAEKELTGNKTSKMIAVIKFRIILTALEIKLDMNMNASNPSRENIQSKGVSNDFIASCENIYLNRSGINVLENVSFGIGKGEIVTLVGPNGSGKTTILKILLSLIEPNSGSVKKEKDLIIGYMPQKISVERIMPITVRRFLRLNGVNRSLRGIDKVEIIAHDLGIGKLLQKQIHEISGGEMQRVLLARALLLQPDLLALDEPTQGLDVQGQEEFYRIIESVKNKYNCGVIMVSHDLHVVMAKTDRVICLNRHICCEGRPEDISHHPEYLSLFGKKEIGDKFAIYPHKHDHSHNIGEEHKC
jgi:zinc transport system ATP-binding protein